MAIHSSHLVQWELRPSPALSTFILVLMSAIACCSLAQSGAPQAQSTLTPREIAAICSSDYSIHSSLMHPFENPTQLGCPLHSTTMSVSIHHPHILGVPVEIIVPQGEIVTRGYCGLALPGRPQAVALLFFSGWHSGVVNETPQVSHRYWCFSLTFKGPLVPPSTHLISALSFTC